MKKPLIVIISLVLLLGVGFMYLVKNPELPIAQKVLSIVGMDKEIDLTNDSSLGTVEITTPATINCENNSGIVKNVQGGSGEILSFCKLPDTTTCEAGAYMEGTCGKSPQGETTASTPGAVQNTTTRDSTRNTTRRGSTTPPQNPSSLPSATPVNTTTTKGTTPSGSTNPTQNISPETATSPTGSTATNTNKLVCTMDYVPVCANIQSQCTNKPCPVTSWTFANKCMMNSNPAARFLYEGECKTK